MCIIMQVIYYFSPTYFTFSMDAFKTAKEKEMKLLNLKRRRSELGEMLAEERNAYAVNILRYHQDIIFIPTFTYLTYVHVSCSNF